MNDRTDGIQYAGFWARVAAYFIDYACVTAVCLLLAIAFSFLGESGLAIAGIAVFLVQLLYWPVLESSAHQATLGKRMLGIRVEHGKGGPTSFLRALGRNLAKIISAVPLCLGFVMVAFTGRKQGLHDIVADCVVVRVGPSHFVKALIGAVLGVIVVAAGTGAFVYYVYLPSMMKDIHAAQQETMKAAPPKAPRPSAATPAAPTAPPRPGTSAAPSPAQPAAPSSAQPAGKLPEQASRVDAARPSGSTPGAPAGAAAMPPQAAPPEVAVPPATTGVATPAGVETMPAAGTGAEKRAAPRRPSRAHLDARECLKEPTDRALMACAERFR